MLERVLADITRFTHHRPVYPGEALPVEPEPYLTLPFRINDLAHAQLKPGQIGITQKIEYEVSEGWFYSKKVRRMVPYNHAAVDFELPYGFPVVAPCDGYAMSSYYSFPTVDRYGKIRRDREGRMICFGIGYFVQIYNQEQNRIVQLGHLSSIVDQIPFGIPTRVGDRWEPINHIQTPEQLIKPDNNTVIFVQKGETVGFVGYSGLTYEPDYQEGSDRPYQINHNEIGSWSVPHIHMDESQRDYRDGKKKWRRDPYDLYQKSEAYPNHHNDLNIGNEPLFLTDINDRPLFADS